MRVSVAPRCARLSPAARPVGRRIEPLDRYARACAREHIEYPGGAETAKYGAP